MDRKYDENNQLINTITVCSWINYICYVSLNTNKYEAIHQKEIGAMEWEIAALDV